MYLAQGETEEDAAVNTLQGMFANALPIQEVVAAAHSFLTRSVHMGSLLMISCIAMHLEVPIVSVDSLRHFFETDEIPQSGDAKQTFDLILSWLSTCVARRRFCLESPGVYSPYITSDGTEEGGVIDESTSALRIKKTRGQDNVHQAVGRKIGELWRRQLSETCHMGTEASVHWNAVEDLLTLWNPDFRQLISGKIFDVQRHMRKLRLEEHVPGVVNWPSGSDKPPPFARPFNFANGSGDVIACGVGVHWSALLLCVSLCGGALLHPKISSNFARSVLREILTHSPPCATPGNNILVRSFNLHTGSVERVIIPKVQRPLHFRRPRGDLHFINTGMFSYARAIGKYLPEDCMHCGFLFRFAELYSVDILEVPGFCVTPEYELLPNEYYSLWNPLEQAMGWLRVNSREDKVIVNVGDTTYELEAWEWASKISQKGFIVTPMIWRRGACVEYPGDNVGCIIPFGEKNFSHEENVYQVLAMNEGNKVYIPTIDVLRGLIPVGTELFLKLNSENIRAMNLELSMTDRNKDYLKCRLDVPPTANPDPLKVHVACLRQPLLARNDTNSMTVQRMEVDPWDILLKVSDPSKVVQHLVCGTR